MLTNRTLCARLCVTLFISLFCSVAFGGAEKVDLCHVPQEDPDNYHTISISEKAVPSHIRHGDTLGECDEDTGGEPPVNLCTCFTTDTESEPDKINLAELGIEPVCTTDNDPAGRFEILFDNDAYACSGFDCVGRGYNECSWRESNGDLGYSLAEIDALDDEACRTLMEAACL